MAPRAVYAGFRLGWQRESFVHLLAGSLLERVISASIFAALTAAACGGEQPTFAPRPAPPATATPVPAQVRTATAARTPTAQPTGPATPVLSPAPAVPPPTWLRVERNGLVNEAGRNVVLRGVNVVWVWRSPPSVEWEKTAIDTVTRAPGRNDGWGANLVVLSIASGPVNRGDETYLRLLDELLATARGNGAYALLVYRNAEPGGALPVMPDEAAKRAMATLAGRYANEAGVLYALQAEPHDVTWPELKPRFTAMIDAIRGHNPRALIAVPGTQWSRYAYWVLADPIARPNLIFNIHYYDPFASYDRDYRLSQLAAMYPVLIGEFGPGSQMELADVTALLDAAARGGLHWAGWAFDQRRCPCMLREGGDFAATDYGAEIKRRLQAGANATP